jgi:hypothetical protein
LFLSHHYIYPTNIFVAAQFAPQLAQSELSAGAAPFYALPPFSPSAFVSNQAMYGVPMDWPMQVVVVVVVVVLF